MKKDKLPILSDDERVAVVIELEKEFHCGLISSYNYYSEQQEKIRVAHKQALARQKAVHEIAGRWSMSIELATESYDLAHGKQQEKGK